MTMMDLRNVTSQVDHAILIYYLGLNLFYLLLLSLSVLEIMRRQWEVKLENEELADEKNFIPISILCPAYNEAPTIADSLRSMLSLDYSNYEVVVINDGSTDKTLEVLKQAYELYPVPPSIKQTLKTAPVRQYYRSIKVPNLLVIDKENGGKSDALNAGINASEFPAFLACDADTLIEKKALRSLASAFLTSSNMVAVGGTIRVVNNCYVKNGEVTDVRFPRDIVPALQAIEYLRAFLLGRLGWNRLGGNLVISGALGLFDRELVKDAGGYKVGIVGEDMELIVRLHHYYMAIGKPKIIRFIADPLAWTEVPATTSSLGKQRERWHRGLIESLWLHKKMFFNPKYGRVGMIGFPFFAIGEMIAPFIEGIGIAGIIVGYLISAIDTEFIVMFFVAAWGVNILLNLAAILAEQLTYKRYSGLNDLSRMVVYAFAENVGFRQVTVWWRLKAFWNVLRGVRSWGRDLSRQGF